ncbi:hypothetical protein TYRP_011946 [Tyrophagus putrescentiae]|nr:hypothetical protein TYRP_011946 [Tyrophagus putrescentiae]
MLNAVQPLPETANDADVVHEKTGNQVASFIASRLQEVSELATQILESRRLLENISTPFFANTEPKIGPDLQISSLTFATTMVITIRKNHKRLITRTL